MIEWLLTKGIHKLFDTVIGKIVLFPLWVCFMLGLQVRVSIEDIRQLLAACNRTQSTFSEAMAIPEIRKVHNKSVLKIIGTLLFMGVVNTLLLLFLESKPAWLLSFTITGMMVWGYFNVMLTYKIDIPYSKAVSVIPAGYWLTIPAVVLATLGVYFFTRPGEAPSVIPTAQTSTQVEKKEEPKENTSQKKPAEKKRNNQKKREGQVANSLNQPTSTVEENAPVGSGQSTLKQQEEGPQVQQGEGASTRNPRLKRRSDYARPRQSDDENPANRPTLKRRKDN